MKFRIADALWNNGDGSSLRANRLRIVDYRAGIRDGVHHESRRRCHTWKREKAENLIDVARRDCRGQQSGLLSNVSAMIYRECWTYCRR